jgi:hypothetical protein
MGIFPSIANWISHPLFSDGDIKDWSAFLVIVLCIAFLWSTVVRLIESEGVKL